MRRIRSTEHGLEPDYSQKQSPQILTRNTELPSLSALDAGDVIECYALTRKAKLENADSVSPYSLMVHKSAIAFRYKTKSTSPDAKVKAPFELTLEYGPQRTGSTQSFEAMPSVNGHHRDLEYEDGDGMYVSWENHAKIYYGVSISDEEWENAYYMAPITGAVLSKVLSDYIMDYPILHPRYQPFTVVEKQSGKSVLNSSNSEDFVWNIFRKLADMYVAIDPILAPKRYAIQLMVEDVQRDVVRLDSNVVLTSSDVSNGSGGTHERKQNVANFAAEFFHNLYSCVEAIKTGDYSAYEDTDVPTLAPSTSSPTASPTVKTTEVVTQKSAGNATDQKAGGGGKWHHNKNKNHNKNKHNNATDTSSGGGINGTIVDNNATDTSSGGGTNGTIVESTESAENDDELADGGTRYLQSINDVVEQIQNIETELNDEDFKPPEIDNFVDDANEAAEEAQKAAEAAQEAAESNEDGKAAEAAGLAAEAAKKAAQATSDAASESLIESLLSGDGDLMTNVIQTCFSDPKYGIQEFEDEKNDLPLSTNAYLYVDGSHYYRLNLTAPFFNVQPSINSLPKTNMVPLGKSDIVDVGLAFAIIGGFFFGVVVMLHHIRVLDWDERLRFKWFFHPTTSGSKKTKRGGYSNTSTRDSIHDDDSISIGGDLELSDRQIPS